MFSLTSLTLLGDGHSRSFENIWDTKELWVAINALENRVEGWMDKVLQDLYSPLQQITMKLINL